MPAAGPQRARMAKICAIFPEVDIREGQHWTFEVRGKKFAYHLDDHHGDGRLSVECKAGPGENSARAAAEPDRYFLPKYMAHHGWIGLYLDRGSVDWDEVDELMTDAYLLVAPKRLAATLRQRLDDA